MKKAIYGLQVLCLLISGCDGVESTTVESSSSRNQSSRESEQSKATQAQKPAFTTEQVAAGRKLHREILSNYPLLDDYYSNPSIHGALTNRPLATICVPSSDWNSLTETQRKSLKAFASSQIAVVKERPLHYARIPASAPAASTVRSNANKMSSNSWGIIIGSMSDDNRDIMLDDVVNANSS